MDLSEEERMVAAKKTKSPAQEGGGTRGGAAMTAAYESLQAYACAARKEKGSALEDIDDVKKFQKLKLADCTNTLPSTLKELDISYHSSCIRTANQIFVDFPQLSKGRYKFYRGKGAVHDQIYATFNRLKQGSGIVNPNKWNPADIWIIKEGLSFKSNFKSLGQFNDYMLDLYNKRDVIGVSLKKLDRKGGAHGTPFNTGQSLGATFKGFKAGDSIVSSKDIYIEFNAQGKAGAVQLRIFSSRPEAGSWQGEIGGKTAAGGKIGGGNMIAAAKAAGVLNTESMKPQMFSSKVNNPSDSVINDFIKLWKEVKGIKSMSKKDADDLKALVKKTAKADKTWFLSKYIGLNYCAKIQESGLLNEVTNWIYRYGSSAVENSSVFIKYGPD
jgi:hypothetical protein